RRSRSKPPVSAAWGGPPGRRPSRSSPPSSGHLRDRRRPQPLLPRHPVRAPAPKYVFVTGGVVSALGKGIVAASLGRVRKARGLRVQLQKFDPYLNVDPGTMSPFQHGEVFVT